MRPIEKRLKALKRAHDLLIPTLECGDKRSSAAFGRALDALSRAIASYEEDAECDRERNRRP